MRQRLGLLARRIGMRDARHGAVPLEPEQPDAVAAQLPKQVAVGTIVSAHRTLE